MKDKMSAQLYTLHLEKQNFLIGQVISDCDYDTALIFVNQVLEGVDLKDSRYQCFLYHKAVILDSTMQVLEAFPIFVELLEARPYDLKYFKSFQVCVENLNKFAIRLIEKNPSDERILNVYHLLTQYHYASYLVCEGAALIYGMRGQTDLAKSMLTARLALSPNDLDVIRASVRIARIIEDQVWLAELRGTLKMILKRYPYRYEVLEVEAGEFEVLWDKVA